jgi:hypothetical protein
MKKPAPQKRPGHEAPAKRGRGQPTAYKPEYCTLIIQHMAYGHSLVSFAAEIGVVKETVNEWARTIPEFSAAKKLALQLCQRWWEAQGMQNLILPEGTKFNTVVWSTIMKNRFRDDYCDKVQHEVTGPEGGPLQLAVSKLSLEEVRARRAEVERQLDALKSS